MGKNTLYCVSFHLVSYLIVFSSWKLDGRSSPLSCNVLGLQGEYERGLVKYVRGTVVSIGNRIYILFVKEQTKNTKIVDSYIENGRGQKT